MPGDGGDTTFTKSNSGPWKQATPLLMNLLRSYGNLDTGVTDDQQKALTFNSILSKSIPNMGPQSFDAIQKMFDFSTKPQVGMLNDAYKTLQDNLGGTADGSQLDPYLTPGFSDALATMTGDITNQVKGAYAGSGRDASGAGSFAGSLGRGLEQGIAPTLMAQFNQNKNNQMSAASTLFGAGQNTATGTAALNAMPAQMAAQGIGLLPGAMQAYMAPAMARMSAANMQYQQPFQNLSALLNPAIALGSLGQHGTQSTTQPQSMFGNILGGLAGGTGILSQMGAFGPAGWLLASDERVKDDIEEVGKLNDGQKVVRFRYKGSPTMRIGLLAQDVAKHKPSAVHNMGGLLAVDYGSATDGAVRMRKAA